MTILETSVTLEERAARGARALRPSEGPGWRPSRHFLARAIELEQDAAERFGQLADAME